MAFECSAIEVGATLLEALVEDRMDAEHNDGCKELC
jgi:hypothetical protein